MPKSATKVEAKQTIPKLVTSKAADFTKLP